MDINWMINHKKSVNKRIKDAKKRIKPVKCPLCGRPLGKTCNSHSVPRMILETISKDGYLYNKNKVDNLEFFEQKSGINKTGTFFYICNSCDNSFFVDYEKPEAIHEPPNDKMLVEIAIKNLLQKMQAKAFEKAIFRYDPIILKLQIIVDREAAIRTFELDYKDYEWYLQKFKRIKEKEEDGEFNIIYRTVLDYEVPIAAQECFTIYKDRNGNMINDPNLDDSDKVQVVHFCIFPFQGKTTVLLFYYHEDSSYDILKKQFEDASDEENLKYVNYYMLALGENYFYSAKIRDEFFTNSNLKKISREYMGERGNFGIVSEFTKGTNYKPVKYDEIPFLLGKKYSLDTMM